MRNSTQSIIVLICVLAAAVLLPCFAIGTTFDGSVSGGQVQPFGPCNSAENTCNSSAFICLLADGPPWVFCWNDQYFTIKLCANDAPHVCVGFDWEIDCAEKVTCLSRYWNGFQWACSSCSASGYCTIAGCS